MQYGYYYLIIINIITFFMYGLDKFYSKKGMWRISEKTLLVLSIIGGCFGGYLGMKITHHKTKKKIFKFVNISMMIIYLIIIIYLGVYYGFN